MTRMATPPPHPPPLPSCSICLETCVEPLRKTTAGCTCKTERFHKECITLALENEHRCPICRRGAAEVDDSFLTTLDEGVRFQPLFGRLYYSLFTNNTVGSMLSQRDIHFETTLSSHCHQMVNYKRCKLNCILFDCNKGSIYTSVINCSGEAFGGAVCLVWWRGVLRCCK